VRLAAAEFFVTLLEGSHATIFALL
jgi:hypothetical protein